MINQLRFSITNLLLQLEQVLTALSDEQFCAPVPLLSKSTIGQHIRHIIEFYVELNKGYEVGIINYDGRKRDHSLQTCRVTAIKKLQEISAVLNKENITLNIYADYANDDGSIQQLSTNYFRELMYNLEHTVHHMALIRVGIHSCTKLGVPDDFGVAASTIKYREQCAQ
ncbi:hypothetical protein WG904_11650 [Pedobacter sp. Du54]|uniref:hypothetical protein n=1 Tax=Pedobacter anseongensis TaxID=3133439 RepID=UPI003099927F